MIRYNGPRVDTTVDAVLFNLDTGQVLLGKKPNSFSWVFPGGFADPVKDNCLLHTVIREVKEETSMDIRKCKISYIGNANIEDPRYADTQDKIFTHIFLILLSNEYLEKNRPKAGDDLGIVGWFDPYQITELAECHERILQIVKGVIRQHNTGPNYVIRHLSDCNIVGMEYSSI